MASRADQLVAAAKWSEERSDEAALDGDVRTAHRLAAQAERLRELAGLELRRRRAAG